MHVGCVYDFGAFCRSQSINYLSRNQAAVIGGKQTVPSEKLSGYIHIKTYIPSFWNLLKNRARVKP